MSLWPSFVGHLQMLQQQSKCICWKTMITMSKCHPRGFGLLGEQGAESIHAKFNRLGLAFSPIKDRVKQLQCIVKEHLLSIEPQIVAAIPPPTKRIKLTQT